MATNNQIPSNWTIAKLGEVCTYSKGKMPQVLRVEKDNGCSIPYINIKAFEKGIFAEYTNGVKCNLCGDDDLLMVWDGARCGLIGKAKKGAVGSTLMKILPATNIHKEYLYHFIKSKFNYLNSKPKGVGIPHIEPILLWNFEFPIPPLPEQHRIIKKIEELFTDLDKGIENLKTAQQQLKVYRQAVMKWAIEGKFDNKNVKEGKLPEGWTEGKFEDLLDYIQPTNYIVASTEYSDEYKIPVLTAGKSFILGYTNEVNGIFNSLPVIIFDDFTTATKFVNFQFKVKSSAMKILKPKNKEVNIKFAFYLMQTLQIKADTHKRYWISEYSKFKILIPSPNEQAKIVYEIESRLSVCDKIEEIIETCLLQSQALRLSIIKRAFEGKLVKQNPKDESAEILLAKIRAEIKKNS